MRNRLHLLALPLFALLLLAMPLAAQPVKHVIVMIADGCGFNQIQAGALYRFGKPEGWVYQSFPVKLAMSHFPAGGSYDPALAWGDFLYVKKGPTDSAASATALATGVKTRNGTLGLDPEGHVVQNIMERAQAQHKATGVVTTVFLDDATPAGFLVHQDSRAKYTDIAAKMIASGANVVMGAGHPEYDNSGARLATPKYTYLSPEQLQQLRSGANGWKLIQTKTEFQALRQGKVPDRVFGLAQVASVTQEGRGGDTKAAAYAVPFNTSVPSLTDMSLGALRVLNKNPKGFCVMIEGGAVDWAGHSNLSGRLVEEEINFSEAVEAVVQWVKKNSNWNETLLIITGDHETGYLAGPGSDPKWQPLVNNGAGKMPGMEWHYGSHTNSLIPLFARGAGSEYFTAHATGRDPVRGKYVDNTDVAKAVFAALGQNP